MKKLLLYLFFFFIFANLLILNSFNLHYKANPSNSLLYQLRYNTHLVISRIVPSQIKTFIKSSVEVYNLGSTHQQMLKNKDTEISNLRLEFKNLEKDFYNKIKLQDYNQILFYFNNPKTFNFKKTREYIRNFNKNKIHITEYSFPLLNIMGPRAYFANNENNLFLITGTGNLIYNSFDNLINNEFIFQILETNFEEIAGKNYLRDHRTIVKHILYDEGKIYVSYIKKIKEECYANSVLSADINYNKLIFKEFFSLDQCSVIPETQAGGTLSKYKDKKILMTIGDHNEYKYSGVDFAQNKDSLYGKIISIDKQSQNYQIISMGHRNPQGLFYDKNDDIIYSAEHGPQGGDEININFTPGEDIKNYGWGISSYGEHYGFPDYPDGDNSKLYEVVPLNKSHEDFGFVEPLKYFVPSIAPSQIIRNDKFITYENKVVLYLAAMGGDVREGDLSIHQFILDKNHTIEDHNIIEINSRVRDIIFLEKLNKMFFYIESDPQSISESSIAVIENIN